MVGTLEHYASLLKRITDSGFGVIHIPAAGVGSAALQLPALGLQPSLAICVGDTTAVGARFMTFRPAAGDGAGVFGIHPWKRPEWSDR
jgi:hypothetical protein